MDRVYYLECFIFKHAGNRIDRGFQKEMNRHLREKELQGCGERVGYETERVAQQRVGTGSMV